MSEHYPQLFSPITIRGLTLKNRVDFPAMATGLATPEGGVTQAIIDYHVARARGGCALLTTEASSVHQPSAPRGFLSIADDRLIDGLRQFNDAIHEAGGRTCVQLWQGGFVALNVDPTVVPVTPSDLPMGPGVTVPGAGVDLIHEVVEAYGAAAARAVSAGFDSVELHAGHNYSIHTFLSPAFNRREDDYGGSAENRMRYGLEALGAIRANIPADMPVLLRVSAFDDGLPGGLTIEDVIAFARAAHAAGADAINVSRGNVVTAAIKFEVPPIDEPRGFNVEAAARFKAETDLVTIAVGRINDPDQAEAILAGGKADMVVMGRAQIADPEFCNKAQAGRTEEILRCIGCNQGCFDRYVSPEYQHISCLQNPAVGREHEFEIKPAERVKRILVAGGGIGGMEAAQRLKLRGHEPVLCEASDSLGGQFYMAGLAPRKREMSDAALGRARTLEHLDVDIRLATPVTPELIAELKPEAVIVAIGSTPITLDLEGSEKNNVVDTETVLTGFSPLSGDVVVIGGGLVGLEVAEYLAELDDRVTSVTVVEMLPEVGADLGSLRKIEVMEHMALDGVKQLVNTRCTSIDADGVNAVDGEGNTLHLHADGVVVAVGSRSRDSSGIVEACLAGNIPCHVIGDAKRPRRAIDAVAEAAEVAMAL